MHAPRRRLLPALAAGSLLTLLALAPDSHAQPYRYGLSDRGRVVVDGVVLDKLASKYDAESGENFEQRWLDLFVMGSDRWALRLDGTVNRNGAKLWKLPAIGFFYWIGIAGGLDGEDAHVYALRNDGLLALDGELLAALPLCDGCGFSDLVSDGTSVWVLRTDGNVYKDAVSEPVFSFVGGDGVNGNPDGFFNDSSTWWTRLVLGDTMLYALRQDGIVFAGELDDGDVEGALQTDLDGPPPGEGSTLSGNLYLDLSMDDEGRWLAQRGDGTVYRGDVPIAPLLEFKGDPIGNQSSAQLYFGLEAGLGQVSGLRFDGKVFTDDDTENPFVDFTGDRYFVSAISADPPDLSNIKNAKPRVAKVKGFGVAGEAISLPLLATDTDKAADELVITVVEPLPEGAVWNAADRTLDFAAPVAGNHKASFLVDDGEAKPVKAKVKLKVLEADVDPEKNKPPLPTKLSGLQALVGVTIEVPIQAVDVDGDELDISADDGGVFDLDETDATFVDGLFSWTPRFEDIGNHKARFFVSDGTKTKKLNLKIKVVNSLIFDDGGG